MNPKAKTRLNALRSGVVVIGALAFGYLSLEVGFKPFLLKAQEQQQQASLREKPQTQEDSFQS